MPRKPFQRVAGTGSNIKFSSNTVLSSNASELGADNGQQQQLLASRCMSDALTAGIMGVSATLAFSKRYAYEVFHEVHSLPPLVECSPTSEEVRLFL